MEESSLAQVYERKHMLAFASPAGQISAASSAICNYLVNKFRLKSTGIVSIPSREAKLAAKSTYDLDAISI